MVVKQDREEAKDRLRTLKESHAPVLRRVRALDSQLHSIDGHLREKVLLTSLPVSHLTSCCGLSPYRELPVA